MVSAPLLLFFPAQVVRIAEGAISGDISSADLPHALSNSRFWLFIHDNVHRALYEGYVEVANTVMVEGLTRVQQLETLLVALLVVEVVLAGVGATGRSARASS
ncbi:hypothetical protein DUNSADRAFT_3998 [Dunaliella salina]|uniref:Encoded protein n=1 Tax=Dunaliella salina TaxID=3046 RepID=A0ABQ7FV19_DUNSA|nr:hypothetical protein DUNSADRAFT_3998 [Dunaliella salina]|eukprot:KAF5826240.1 hypothetical protein DUNSADRAFT_3998 [Dunaliella salina]